MTNHTRTGVLFAALALAGAGCSSKADQAADNTGRKARDRGHRRTSDPAVDKRTDLDVTRQIRKAVVADDSLSMNAKNVKIIVADHTVTLRGPVASADERRTIERLATQHSASYHVVNELELAP